MKNLKKFLELITEMENTEGYKIDSQAYELENSFIITVVNYAELKQYLEFVPVFSVEQKRNGESRKFMLNALRLFSNFLASSSAFVDHTRNFIRRIYVEADSALDGMYQRKVCEEFTEDNLSGFVEDLRNFAQHYKSLPVAILTRVKNDSFQSCIVLNKNALLESGYSWNKGKVFLDSTQDSIDVLQISENYLYKTIFPWIMQQQAKYHRKEFKELERLRKLASELYYENKK